MATLKPELKAILARYDIDPRDKSQVWDCHGVLVLYHKAYEIIAAKEGIRFDPPTIIEGNGADLKVAMVVVGHMGDRAEWSVGEASPLNYKVSGKQQPYPYAMAEKRAKDRVVAKLVGLAAYVYSEDEADEFKAAKPTETDAALTDTVSHAKETAQEVAKRECAALYDGIKARVDDVQKMDEWMAETQERRNRLPAEMQSYLRAQYNKARSYMLDGIPA